MSLLRLPNEIIFHIASYLKCDGHVNVLMQTTRRFYHLLNPYFYRNNIRHSHCSALKWAARHGIISVAQKMFQEGAPARYFLDRRHPWSSIVTAASYGHDAVVKLCLEWSADPDPGMLIYPDGKESEYTELTPIWTALVRGHQPTLRTLFVHIVRRRSRSWEYIKMRI